MLELIVPLHSQDKIAILENPQARLRELNVARRLDAAPSPAVKKQLRPSPRMLEDAEASDSVTKVRAEAQRGVDVATVHNGLDPQRVAKLLGLLE